MWNEYYPLGGMNDLHGRYGSIEEARAQLSDDYEGYQITDSIGMTVLEEGKLGWMKE